MKAIFNTILALIPVLCIGQVDSTEFRIDKDIKLSKISLDEAIINKNKLQTVSNDLTYVISIDNRCNLLAPKYSDLNEGGI